jgi:hypothetical protein
MLTTQAREVSDARQATALDFVTEPSHIHIPRPSRLRPATIEPLADDESVGVELALEDEAA